MSTKDLVFDVGGSHLKALGAELRSMQEKRNLSNRELGTIADVTYGYLSHIHLGLRNTTLGTLEKVARALGGELVISVRAGRFLAADGPPDAIGHSTPIGGPRLTRGDRQFMDKLAEIALRITDHTERVVLLQMAERSATRSEIERLG